MITRKNIQALSQTLTNFGVKDFCRASKSERFLAAEVKKFWVSEPRRAKNLQILMEMTPYSPKFFRRASRAG